MSDVDRQSAACMVEDYARQQFRPWISRQYHYRSEGVGRVFRSAETLCRCSMPALSERSVRRMYLHTQTPLMDVTNFGADILYPVLVRDADALGNLQSAGRSCQLRLPDSSRVRARTSSRRLT